MTCLVSHVCSNVVSLSLHVVGLMNIYNVAANRADEFEKYKTYSAPEPDESILVWWQSNKNRFPILSELARSYLAIPGSSTESERLFSAGGNMVTKKRSSLKHETVRRAQCLRSWWLKRELFSLPDNALPLDKNQLKKDVEPVDSNLIDIVVNNDNIDLGIGANLDELDSDDINYSDSSQSD